MVLCKRCKRTLSFFPHQFPRSSHSYIDKYPFTILFLSPQVSPDAAMALTPPVTATVGDTRTLQCQATANPQAEFLWSHDTAGELTGQGEDGNLEVTFVNLCGDGTYTCTLHNDHGDGDGATISVTLKGLWTMHPETSWLFFCERKIPLCSYWLWTVHTSSIYAINIHLYWSSIIIL